MKLLEFALLLLQLVLLASFAYRIWKVHKLGKQLNTLKSMVNWQNIFLLTSLYVSIYFNAPYLERPAAYLIAIIMFLFVLRDLLIIYRYGEISF